MATGRAQNCCDQAGGRMDEVVYDRPAHFRNRLQNWFKIVENQKVAQKTQGVQCGGKYY